MSILKSNNENLVLNADGATSDVEIQSNGSTKVTVDDGGNVLVGTTTNNPSVNNEYGIELAETGSLRCSANNTTPFLVNKGSADGALINLRKDGTTVGSIGTVSGEIAIGSNTTGVRFTDAADRIDPWNITSNTARDDAIDLGTGTRRFKDLYLSGGAYLGGTAAANKLDDYEEGTWTPTIIGSGGGSATIGSTHSAKYTKIGNLVHVTFYISAIDTTGAGWAASLRIGGLPFSSNPSYGQNSSVGYTNLFNFDEGDISLYGYAEGTQVALQRGSAMSSVYVSNLNSITNGRMMFGMTYYA